jgi:hypothetical protein
MEVQVFSRDRSDECIEMPRWQRHPTCNAQAISPERRYSRAPEFIRNAASLLAAFSIIGGLLLHFVTSLRG